MGCVVLERKIKQISILLGLSFLLLSGAAWAHPLKMSSALISQNPSTHMIGVEIRVFTDDFQLSVLDAMEKGAVPVIRDKSKRNLLVESYFQKYLVIGYNGKIVPLKFESIDFDRVQNIYKIKFADVFLKLKENDRLVVKNTVMLKDFGLSQTNRFSVLIPAFQFKAVEAATVEKHYFTYTMGETRE